MRDKTVKLHLKMKDRKRLQRLCVESGRDHRQVVGRALKELERARKRSTPTDSGFENRFRVHCEIEGQDTAETLEQLQGFVNDIVQWLRAHDVPEADIPVMLVALGAQCIREGERSQRFLDEQQARYEE